MNPVLRRLARLMWGLFLFALGIAITLNAQIGYAPWDTFHVGLSTTIGISIGTASISVGLVIMLLTVSLREKIGLGTILNMFAIGSFLDLILALNILPVAPNLPLGIAMLILGLIIISFGSYFYMDSGFGAGPRDSLMVALTRKTRLPIGVCRAGIEGFALFLGWRLGGMVGVGTILSVFLTGFFVQWTFKLMKFDATQVQHETLGETVRALMSQGTEEKEGRRLP